MSKKRRKAKSDLAKLVDPNKVIKLIYHVHYIKQLKQKAADHYILDNIEDQKTVLHEGQGMNILVKKNNRSQTANTSKMKLVRYA